MKVVIADTGALISLVHIGRIDLIEKVFNEFYLSKAVWVELNKYDNPYFDHSALTALKAKVREISSKNYLAMVMDLGESESVILYEEMQADYLLIDDNKARLIAESFNINCIGTLGLLLKAKQKGFITELKPIFEKLIQAGRYFSKRLLNDILIKIGESTLK
jgi:uncharacterized protein